MRRKVLGSIYIWLILLLMYLPILVIIAFSFTKATNIGQWTGFTFDLYGDLFKNKEIMIALGNTVLIALISASVSTILGTLGAIGAFYSKRKVRRTIEGMTQLPIVNAEIVVAFSLVIMFVAIETILGLIAKSGNPSADSIRVFSFWTLLIGHVSLSIPFVFVSVKPKLEQMDPCLYEAAVDLGANHRQALRKVVLPETIPGILSGFLLSVTLSLDDFIITAFTRGSGLLSGENKIETLSTLVQAKIKKGPIPVEMRSLTTIIFIFVIIAVVLVTIYQRNMAKKKKIKHRRMY